MDSNRCSCRHSDQPTGSPPDRLTALAADLDGLDAEDLDGLTDTALAQRLLGLRQLVDRLDGQWLKTLAAVDGRGAAGADQGIQAASTAGWLRNRLHLGAAAATSAVRHSYPLERVAQPLAQAAGLADPDERLLKAVIRP
jgi:hypothetical protein